MFFFILFLPRKARSFLPVQCLGCKSVFEKTLKLTEHLMRTKTCMQSMGGSIDAAKKIIARKKRKRRYDDNREEEQAERRERHRVKRRFNVTGQFGPSFPCVVCHSLNWLNNVTRVALTDIDERFLCLTYIEKHKLLFFKKGKYYCCRRCREKIGNGDMPANAARNNLLCPWDNVSQDHLMLSEVLFKSETL